MDFRHNQEITKSKTRRLVLFFTFFTIVFVMIANLIYLAYLVFYKHLTYGPDVGTNFLENITNAFFHYGDSMFKMSLFTIGTLLFGYWLKTWDLNKTGVSGIVRKLGGFKVNPDSINPQHKVLYNVVEEIAVAAVVPVPEVYVLTNQKSINAFAIGNTIYDAAIGVTSGALDNLTREELQSVVAHEFSHIVNDDCRLNMRLIAITYGYFMWYEFSRVMFETFARGSTRRSRRSSSSDDGKGEAAILILMFVLFCFGFLSYIFSKAIKSSISRTREYLADATAVQFTRNPVSLASALLKIKEGGRKLEKAHAAAYSEHSFAFFSNHMASYRSLFASHPPLLNRVKKIGLSPSQVKLVYPEKKSTSEAAEKQSTKATIQANEFVSYAASYEAAENTVSEGSHISNDSDTSSPQHNKAVASFLASYLSFDRASAHVNLANLKSKLSGDFYDSVKAMLSQLKDSDEMELFKNFERSIYVVKDSSKKQKETLMSHLTYLIEHDGIIDLRELLIYVFCSKSLNASRLKQKNILTIDNAEEILINNFKDYKKTHKKTKVDQMTSLSIDVLGDNPLKINAQKTYDALRTIKANSEVKANFLASYQRKMGIEDSSELTLIDHIFFAIMAF